MARRIPWRQIEKGLYVDPNYDTSYQMYVHRDKRVEVRPSKRWFEDFSSARDWIEGEVELGRGFPEQYSVGMDLPHPDYTNDDLDFTEEDVDRWERENPGISLRDWLT